MTVRLGYDDVEVDQSWVQLRLGYDKGCDQVWI